jgi:hypothetical protein
MRFRRIDERNKCTRKQQSRWHFWQGLLPASRRLNPRSLNVKIQYEDPIRNRHYPELLYWFVAPRTLNSHHYAQDIRHISRDTAFDFPFLTAREGVDFLNNPAAHAAVADIVKTTHENGLRIGMTLLGFPALGTAR